MASYNELNALIDAYINRNGVQAITGQILNGVLKAMVEQLGRGYTIMGAATPTTDPGTPDGPECYFASETGTYTDFDGLQVAPGELALLCYTPSDGWTKATIYEGFQEVGATIDGNVGTPSVGVSYANGVLSFDFHNMKGNPGQNGQDGAAAGFGTIGADITGGVGTPGVSVESSGPATAKNLQFHFTNLKGETGVTSVVATVDNTIGTPTCTVSLVGQQLTLAFSGLKGAQGDTGSSVDYPFTIANNLTTDDATQALSASQGVALQAEVSQLEAEIDVMQTGQAQNYESGKYLSVVNGVLKEIADAAWGITDFVPYTYDNPVSWRYADTGSYAGRNIAFYDSNKQYINNAYWGGTNAGVRNILSSEIQTYAQGSAYIRASFKIGDGCYIKENGVTIWQPQEGRLGLQLLQNEITEIDGEVSNLDTRVTALESGSSDGSAASLNKFKESAIVSIAAKIGTQVPKVKDNFLCFLHISDIHGDAERMKRAIAFANSQNNITAILATGDFSQSEWTSDGFEKTFTELYQTANIPMLPIIGNHDVGLRTKIYNPANSNQAVGARFISPFMTAMGCVQGGTDAGYYYKDFSSFNVRLIVVNEYEMPRVPNSENTELKYNIWGRYISQAQADWLVSTLNSVQSGWSVIIATHQLIDVFNKYDNEFKGAVKYSNADVELAQEGMLQDIMDAYIAKGTLTKTYSVSGADHAEVPDVSVTADFSGANGDFICYINGHTHNDGTGQSSYAQAKQVNINVTTGSANVSNQAVYDDLYRDNDTIAQDAFNLVAFDTINKKIRMLRIGANVTMDMKRRDYALIPYSQS